MFEHHDQCMGIVYIYLVYSHFLNFTIAILALNVHVIVGGISSLGVPTFICSVHKETED